MSNKPTFFFSSYPGQGERNAEINFCENKSLNMQTLRMTWEAKVSPEQNFRWKQFRHIIDVSRNNFQKYPF